MTQSHTKKHPQHLSLLEFLGSMNLAITILVVLAIASIIGTVLQQNQPYTDYIIKFGPFWHEVFKALDLYDVYGSLWFLGLLGFLLLSTSVCIYRNAPVMWRDMRVFRIKVTPRSLRLMHNVRELDTDQPPEAVTVQAEGFLRRQGFRFRRKQEGELTILSAMKGGWNRMGYIFTHTGIVVICIGGLMDGNLLFTIKEWRDQIRLETRNIPVSEVPAISRLKPGESFSFRGSVSIPEGERANVVFLNVRDGYLVQELPFAIELRDFRIEHYPSGQPKSFESDLVIHDDQLDAPLEKTIAVNHPLIYRGYAIYQASFADGGSKLKFRLWPFYDRQGETTELDMIVGNSVELDTPVGPMTLELDSFKEFNVFPATEPEQQDRKFVNYGASVVFRLRDASGQAREYQNYMSPILQDGRHVFITGVRDSPAEPFRFLSIPADRDMSLKRFMAFHRLIQDSERVRQIAIQSTRAAMSTANLEDEKLQANVVESMLRLLKLFNEGGYVALDDYIRQSVPEEKQMDVGQAYMKILQNLLRDLYVQLLIDEGVDLSQGVSDEDAAFYDDAVNNLAGIGAYGAPFYLQLTDYDLREATGLQITRSPGKDVVYLGSFLLIVGIFMMFYIAHQRLWILVWPGSGGRTAVLFSGAGDRNRREFTERFTVLADKLAGLLQKNRATAGD